MITVNFATDCPDKLRLALLVIRESGLPCHVSAPPPMAISQETGPMESAWRAANPGERVKFTAARQAQHGTREAFFASLLASPDNGPEEMDSDSATGATYDGPEETDSEGGDPDSF